MVSFTGVRVNFRQFRGSALPGSPACVIIKAYHFDLQIFGGLRMFHDVSLNIHYSMLDGLWEKIGEVYASMPYWSGEEKGPR